MKKFDIKFGSRRTVFLVYNKVYKIPRFKRFVSFIRGITENLEERYWYSADGSRKRNTVWSVPNLAEIYYADRFGLLVVMERADTEMRPITYDIDYINLSNWASKFTFHKDFNESNVGYIRDKLVVIDYGFFGGTMDCYIGT